MDCQLQEEYALRVISLLTDEGQPDFVKFWLPALQRETFFLEVKGAGHFIKPHFVSGNFVSIITFAVIKP